jgi:hypothetical protein
MDEDQIETILVMQKHVDRIWRKSRPKLVKAYELTEELNQRTEEAATQWVEMEAQLMSEGMSYLEAQNMAMREFVSLPDLGDE